MVHVIDALLHLEYGEMIEAKALGESPLVSDESAGEPIRFRHHLAAEFAKVLLRRQVQPCFAEIAVDAVEMADSLLIALSEEFPTCGHVEVGADAEPT